MGFSIGGLLKSIAGPLISVLPIPGAPLIGAAVSAGFAGGSARVSIPGPSVTQPLITAGAARMPLALLGAALTIAELLRMSRENTGRPASARKIREAARVCGLEVAAQTFGLSVTQVCQIIIARPRRRGRGISAADMRRTRSTIRKVATIQHNLAHLVGHIGGRKRGAHGRFI